MIHIMIKSNNPFHGTDAASSKGKTPRSCKGEETSGRDENSALHWAESVKPGVWSPKLGKCRRNFRAGKPSLSKIVLE
jgi:hypothetical protein